MPEKRGIKMTEKCERCGGTGKVGTAISTEGPQDIFCLDCLGTGIKKERKPFSKMNCPYAFKRLACEDFCIDYLDCDKEEFRGKYP